MTQPEINALLLSAISDLWSDHHGGYVVQASDPDRDEKIAAGKARNAHIESIRAQLAAAAAQFPVAA